MPGEKLSYCKCDPLGSEHDQIKKKKRNVIDYIAGQILVKVTRASSYPPSKSNIQNIQK